MRLPPLRAPTESGRVLVHPPFNQIAELVATNERRLNSGRVGEIRAAARVEILSAARDYLSAGGELLPESAGRRLFLSGHQPELFHPGVWLKNFALNRVARDHGGVALNLVVDNDTAKSTSIRVPAADADPRAVHLESAAFDAFDAESPYEERRVEDEAIFHGFGRRIAELSKDWPSRPLALDFGDSPLLGERLVSARRRLERRFGCHNLEVPISAMCRTASFARFATDLIADLPAFHETYNSVVREYRREHRVRSRNHPVPDLARDGDWLEAPFWAWRTGAARRGRLFVRPCGPAWELRCGDERWPCVENSVAAWRRLEADGYKVRTRALTTTLFARLCLADLFIHGIGGGKYDELTDRILERHFGVAPPAFLVLTGTLLLPLPGFAADAATERDRERDVRDRRWNPQRYLSDAAMGNPAAVAALSERAAIDATTKAGYRRMRIATEALRAFVDDGDARLARDRAKSEAAANAILRRRDFSFCLYPEAELRAFLNCFEPDAPAR